MAVVLPQRLAKMAALLKDSTAVARAKGIQEGAALPRRF
jgi:hypothetical protein